MNYDEAGRLQDAWKIKHGGKSCHHTRVIDSFPVDCPSCVMRESITRVWWQGLPPFFVFHASCRRPASSKFMNWILVITEMMREINVGSL